MTKWPGKTILEATVAPEKDHTSVGVGEKGCGGQSQQPCDREYGPEYMWGRTSWSPTLENWDFPFLVIRAQGRLWACLRKYMWQKIHVAQGWLIFQYDTVALTPQGESNDPTSEAV